MQQQLDVLPPLLHQHLADDLVDPTTTTGQIMCFHPRFLCHCGGSNLSRTKEMRNLSVVCWRNNKPVPVNNIAGPSVGTAKGYGRVAIALAITCN